MKLLKAWLMVALPVTLLCLVIYAVGQQAYRTSLDDPQIQIAEDAAHALANGAEPAEVLPQPLASRAPAFDMATSLAPWIAVYDASGTVLESSASLNGKPPVLPTGVFDTSTWLKHQNGTFYNQGPVLETRFTWQPEPGVRQAVVLVKVGDRYVVAGRNMREVEQRIEHEGEIVFIGWLVILAQILVVQFVYGPGRRSAQDSARRG